MSKKVLIIDDDPDIVEAEKMILESHGYDVDSASDGESGLAKAEKTKPDLIILDVMMSTMDQGFQVAYKLKQSPDLKKIPVLMATSVGQVTKFKFDPKTDSDFLPVEAYIEKPIKPADLISTVERLLRA
ncbi:MAG TPA: response regulator [Planctomycetota bacterium]|nr:response regulator [Planctomycetota bacterium]